MKEDGRKGESILPEAVNTAAEAGRTDKNRKPSDENDFSKGSVVRHILSLAAPMTLAQLINVLYSVVDRIYIGHLPHASAQALTGIGLCLPIITIISAFANLFGMGGAPLCSIARGGHQEKRAQTVMGNSFSMLLLTGAVLMIFCFAVKKPLLYMFGASESTYGYADQYITIYLLGTIFVMVSLGMNNFINAQGFGKMGMLTVLLGAVMNIILDPIFIFSLDLGTAGAAIATAISQCISFIILLSFFIRKKSDLNLRVRSISFDLKTYRDIVVTGLPTLSRQGFASLSTICLNVVASSYGDAAIAAMSIAGRIAYFLFSFMLGFGQGFQPVAAFNYGAGLYKRVKDATKFTALVGTLLLFSISVICFLFAPDIIKLFRADDEVVVTLGSVALRLQCVALFLSGVTTTSNMALQSTGQSVAATVLALSRQGIFFIPLVIILPHLFGIFGLLSAQAIADVLTFILSIFFFRSFLRKLDRMSNGRDC